MYIIMHRVITVLLLVALYVISAYSAEKIPLFALDNALNRRSFTIDTIGALHVNVYTEKDLRVTSTYRSIVFELCNNIIVNSTIHFHGQNSYYIKGNGFSIIERESPKPKRSLPYQAKSWSVDKVKRQLTIKLNSPIDITKFRNQENIYVVYEAWFLRFKGKMISVNDSTLTFGCDDNFLSNRKFLTLTPSPYFYLEEKPTKSHELKNMLVVGENINILIDGVSFRGASTCCILNNGTLKILRCKFDDFEKDGIVSTGGLFVEKTKFSNITSYCITAKPKSYLEVIANSFKNIGLLGTNKGCVWGSGDSYIANNRFEDFNYSAIRLGNKTNNKDDYSSAIVENNIFTWTPEWENLIKIYGLIDGGAIYIYTCNKRSIVRYNTILNFGGHGYNRAIYCDDGAFNVSVYGNVIKGTRNSYDIDSRDCSPKWKRQGEGGTCPNTGNYIGYNICDGTLKLEGASAIKENRCVFENNIIVNKQDDGMSIIRNIKNSNFAIVYDAQGYIDKKGRVKLKNAKKIVKPKAPSL